MVWPFFNTAAAIRAELTAMELRRKAEVSRKERTEWERGSLALAGYPQEASALAKVRGAPDGGLMFVFWRPTPIPRVRKENTRA